jgi:uncharacterized protein GlcG (DUF336 family)
LVRRGRHSKLEFEDDGRWPAQGRACGDNKGANLHAIAYSKASEMADTLQASGSKARPPMTGEFGWPGGVIVRGKTGYWIAAFSGGKSEEDAAVSRAGLAAIR